jgi:cell division protein FtsI/penicillin-binding protein 2
MVRAIASPRGTGHRASVPGVSMAGKTGTAEYGRKEDRKYRGWMIVYAPVERPRYAVVMVVDDAVSGGSTVGPLMQHLVAGLFDPEYGTGVSG